MTATSARTTATDMTEATIATTTAAAPETQPAAAAPAEAPPARQRILGVRDYLDALVGIIRSPSRFYGSLDTTVGWRRPMMFLFISALFNASASMSYFFDGSPAMGLAFLANALIMPVLAAVFTFILAGIGPSAGVRFEAVLAVHAYALGAIMTVSWIPSLGALFEVVRAVLVGVGLHKACGLGRIRSALLVAGTAILLLMFFWSLAPVLMEAKKALLS